MSKLYKLDTLSYLMKLVLTTGRLTNSQPLSALIIAKVGSGKTELVSQFTHTPGVLFTNHITPFALWQDFGIDLLNGKFHHIILPDLSVQLSKGKDERGSLITFLNSLMEEGIGRWATKYVKWAAKLDEKIASRTIGIIACVSSSDWESKQKLVQSDTTGFFSRLIPISYSYSDDTVNGIFELYCKGFYSRNHSESPALPEPEFVVPPESLSKVITSWAKQYKDPTDTYGFRRWKHISALVCANALLNGRKVVNQLDMKVIKEFMEYFNYEGTKVI